MNWHRLALALIAGFGTALVAYGMVYTHGNPRPEVGDPVLAFRLIPLELLVGALAGFLVYRAFGRRADTEPRNDVADRMVVRLAMRHGGRFTFEELVRSSPLTEPQARETLARLITSGRLREESGQYILRE